LNFYVAAEVKKYDFGIVNFDAFALSFVFQPEFLVESEKFDFENQSRVSWDHWWKSSGTVSIIWTARQSTLFVQFHHSNTFVPTSDNLAHAELELEWGASVSTGIEFVAVGQGANVVDGDLLAGLW